MSYTSSAAITAMEGFLKNNGNFLSCNFVFNCKTGYSTGEIQYQKIGESQITSTVENVGSMVKSNYLILKDKNYPDTNGNIVAFTASGNNPQNGHRITFENPDYSLNNFVSTYLYMYY